MKTRKTFLVLLAVVAISALAVTFLPQKSPQAEAATQDTVSIGLTFGSAISITIGDTSITPSIVADDAGTTDANHTIVIASNDASGVHVTLGVASAETIPVADRLCTNPDYTGDCDNTDYFLTDGTASYINLDAAEYNTAIPGTLSYQDQNPLDTSTAAVEIFSTDATSVDGVGDDSTFQVTYDFYGDYTIVAQTYNGVLTFDIVSGT